MPHPFTVLAPEYTALLAAMRLDPAREHELAQRAAKVLELAHRHCDEWAEVEARTGVPRLWGLASFEREASSDYSRSPGQGDRWDRVSVHVPAGLGPYRCWADACVEAYRIDRLDEVARPPSPAYAGGLERGRDPEMTASPSGSAASPSPDPSPASGGGEGGLATASGGGEMVGEPFDKGSGPALPGWTWPRALYEGELYNGFGPRGHGRRTSYLWSWTNIYDGGKYVADGRWDPAARDAQCGMAPMMAALARLDSTLALADAPPWAGSADTEPLSKGSAAPVPGSPASLDKSSSFDKGSGGGADGASASAQQPARPGPPVVPDVFAADATAWMQAALNRWGAERLSKPGGSWKHERRPNDLPLLVDGCYGRHTRRAVAAFQAAHGLAPDGLAGPVTLAALRALAP